MECLSLVGFISNLIWSIALLFFVTLLGGVYLIYRKQNQLIEQGEKREKQMRVVIKQTELITEIAKNTEAIPKIAQQFTIPQYLAQLTLILENHNKNVLRLGDVIFVTVQKKMLEFHTVDRVFKMEGNLNALMAESRPILPYPLFVRMHKSYIINILQVEKYYANKVVMKDEKDTSIIFTLLESRTKLFFISR